MTKAIASIIILSDRIEYMIQHCVIAVLNRIYVHTKSIKRQNQNLLLLFSFVLIELYFILIYSGKSSILYLSSQFSRHIVGVILLIPVFIFGIDRELEPVKWRKKISVPLIGSGVLMLIISFIHPIGSGYRVFSLMLIIVFPALALIWNNRKDYYVLLNSMAYAISLVGIVYAMICLIGSRFGWTTWQGSRFEGIMSHSGNLSQLATSVFCSGLYIYTYTFKRGKVYCYASAIIGVGVGMLLLGQGRSCILACIASFAAALYFFIKYTSKGNRLDALKRIVISLMIIVLVSASLTELISKEMSDKKSEQITKTAYVETIKIDNFGSMSSIAMLEGGNTAVDDVKNRFSSEGKDLNQFSSGRIALWNLVLEHLNMWGNNVEEQSIYDLTQNSWLIYAHNVFLEIAYRCGIPLGFIFLILEYTAGCIALNYLFINRKKKKYLLFPILLMIVYFTQSMLDCAGMPFILESGLYYYFALVPMMDRYV